MENKISKFTKIILIFGIILFIFMIIWSISIIPQQLKFMSSCEDSCLSENKTYETKFNSIPWNNLNGKCLE